MSEGERGRRGGQGGDRQSHSFGSSGEDLGFYPKGGGSPGGLWAEEMGRYLTEMLTGLLWWLQGRQTVGSQGGSLGTKVGVTALVQRSSDGGPPGGGFCRLCRVFYHGCAGTFTY